MSRPQGIEKRTRIPSHLVWKALGQTNKKNDGALLYTSYINRPLGRVIAYLAYSLGLSPTSVTIASFSLSIVGIVSIFVLQPLRSLDAVAIVFVLLLAYAIDSADGRLARLTGRTTLFGEWLDHVFDIIKISAIHGSCIFIFSRSSYSNVSILFLANVLVLSAAVTSFFAPMLRDKLDPSKRSAGDLHSRLRVLLLPFDYGAFCFIFLLGPTPDLFTLAYLSWGCAFCVKLLAALAKSGRGLAAVER